MSLEMKVPEVGESITEVTIASWLKQDGDYVEQDEIIAELESDKATFELPAEKAGILKIVAQEGDTIEIGAALCSIEDGGESSSTSGNQPDTKSEAVSGEGSEPKKTGEVKEMIVPTVGESITEVTISSWLKESGDYVELDEIIAEVESDKATFELPAEANGVLDIVAQEGDTIEIGALICKIEVMEGGSPSSSEENTTESVAQVPASQVSGDSYAAGHASPAASKIINEKGISSDSIQGTGVGGRITKEDALKAEKAPIPA
ncbi:MAG: biotin/lipoyl-containing protein, partial [Bacteroidota bacterium]